MRERSNDFIQLSLRINNYEPIDDGMNAHLDLWGRSDVVCWITPREYSKVDHLARKGVTLVEPANVIKYGLEDAKVVGTLTVLNTEATIKVADIVVDDPRDWAVLLVSLVKRISSFF